MTRRSAASPSSFLRIPPFPNSLQTAALIADGVADCDLSDQELDDCIASLGESCVGGCYWGCRPALPDAPYIVVRARDAKVRAQILASAGADRAVLLWLDSGHHPSVPVGAAIEVVHGDCDPWHLVQGAVEVVVDGDDELALVAAISNTAVRCVSAGPFEVVTKGRSGLLDVLRGPLVGARSYVSPFTGQPIGLMEAIDLCSFWRRLIDSNRAIKAALGFAAWKKPTVAPLLWAGNGVVPFSARAGQLHEGDEVAIWKSRVPAKMLGLLADKNVRLIEVEDGFVRSVGLGADCVPPLSIIVDRLGIYFDPQHSSELEALLETFDFPADLVARAAALRQLIVESGISKYGVGRAVGPKPPAGLRKILVVGQVEDDRSVRSGGGPVQSNLELLRRVRGNAGEAMVYYRPHPDVQAGHRIGRIADEKLVGLADEVVSSGSISEWIDSVDEVHVNTSLAGFEALLRGKPVTTYGVPFYAGWGLTNDLGDVPSRRSAKRELDELVAAALLIYPRYLDPQTGLPCPPEILVARLAEGGAVQSKGPLVRFRQMQGRWKRLISSLRSE